jgi:hypothetical protein
MTVLDLDPLSCSLHNTHVNIARSLVQSDFDGSFCYITHGCDTSFYVTLQVFLSPRLRRSRRKKERKRGHPHRRGLKRGSKGQPPLGGVQGVSPCDSLLLFACRQRRQERRKEVLGTPQTPAGRALHHFGKANKPKVRAYGGHPAP